MHVNQRVRTIKVCRKTDYLYSLIGISLYRRVEPRTFAKAETVKEL